MLEILQFLLQLPYNMSLGSWLDNAKRANASAT